MIAGDYVVVTYEPFVLHALDKMTGKTVWRTECDLLASVDPDAYAATGALKKRVTELWSETGKKKGEVERLAKGNDKAALAAAQAEQKEARRGVA